MRKSPFPGMDPFIEAQRGLWKDFHDKLAIEIERTIAPGLPDHYVVRAGARTYVEYVDSAFAELEPIAMQPLIEFEVNEVYLEIFDLYPERRLVTSIELLSPSNKRRGTEGWDQYYRKRRAMLQGFVNFVEIDLLRGGTRLPMANPWPTSPYYILVSRAGLAATCKAWPAYSLQPLPQIPLPLSPPDADVLLDLQSLVDEVYSRSRYHLDIKHDKTPATLDPAETAWLENALRESKP